MLRSARGSKWGYYTWLFFFNLNYHLIKSDTVGRLIWNFIKCELFYIDGDCQKSGNCCQKLQLKRDGSWLFSMTQFVKAKAQNRQYQRFFPTLKNGRIAYFSCQFLKSDKTCADYSNRPEVCRQYPYSFF